ncbi:hypothetical protein [Methanosarcina sp. UBA289]|uniref:hypothetical protein n=1 Tax=Methanosarcina sp. UBA289 TaxID=1915574 RepID=UPI0025F6F74A|nr:hypothetical protein [Methanosarcina sp. UBA289]
MGIYSATEGQELAHYLVKTKILEFVNFGNGIWRIDPQETNMKFLELQAQKYESIFKYFHAKKEDKRLKSYLKRLFSGNCPQLF